MNTGLLILRLVVGLGLAAHGAQKLFGWFGGHGLRGTGGFLEGLGFYPGRRFALIAGLAEFGGGLMTALGFFGPIGPALGIVVMVVAMVTVHIDNGFFVEQNGVERPLLYAAGAAAITLTGPGTHSLDAWLGLAGPWGLQSGMIALALGILIGVGSLALRRHRLGQPEKA
ncbi:MAG TPA: DoxX family protein [Gemmatimonadales bacterium]|nr:DoxX family protein [Gemmatimonadales bacterium]